MNVSRLSNYNYGRLISMLLYRIFFYRKNTFTACRKKFEGATVEWITAIDYSIFLDDYCYSASQGHYSSGFLLTRYNTVEWKEIESTTRYFHSKSIFFFLSQYTVYSQKSEKNNMSLEERESTACDRARNVAATGAI